MVLRHANLKGGRGGILSEKRRRRAAQARGARGGGSPISRDLSQNGYTLSLSPHRYMCRHVHICNQHEKQSTLQQASCVCRLCRFTCVCARESAGYVCMYVYIYMCVCLCFCLCVCVFACLFFWSSATDTKSEATSSESIPCQGAE